MFSEVTFLRNGLALEVINASLKLTYDKVSSVFSHEYGLRSSYIAENWFASSSYVDSETPPPLPYSARHRVNFVQLLSIPFGIESLLTIAFKNAKKVASGPL